jgi:hypothetical protein
VNTSATLPPTLSLAEGEAAVSKRVRRPARPLTLTLSPSGGEGIVMNSPG